MYRSQCTHSIVGMDGRVARLDSTEPVISSPSADSADAIETKVATADQALRKRKADELATSSPEWNVWQSELKAFVGDDAATEVMEFLQAMESSPPKVGSTMFVKLPPVAEKDQRRALHEWIKSRLSSCAAADTVDGHIRIWHSSFATFMPNKLDNHRHKRVVPSAPRNMPFVRFVLYKENMDSGSAMNQITKRGSFNRGGGSGRGRGGRGRGQGQAQRLRLGYAGNKDKRGITSQFITIPAKDTSVKHLCNVFNGSKTGEACGGGHTRSAGVGMMRVGNFEYCADQLQLGRLRGNRFDVALRNVAVGDSDSDNSPAPLSKEILEQAASAIKSSGFINYFGTQRFGKYHDTHLTGMAVLRGNYEAAVDMILEPKTNDRADLYAARVQWQNRFKDMPEGADRAAVEKEVAGKVLRCMNGYMQSENAILNSLVRHPLDYKRAYSCIVKTMRMMFIHALQSFLWNKAASFRIDTMCLSIVEGDLVLAEPNGDGNAVQNNRDGCPEAKLVTVEDVAMKRYSLEDVVLPLIGAKTRSPGNASGDVFDAVLKEHNLTREMIEQLDEREFQCCGDYRKLICRPTDVDFNIIEYVDELQPLLQTDFMKLHGMDVVRNSAAGEPAKSEGKDLLLAMVVGFSLPSSSYATIFLRELMKRPTSSEYQSDLKLGADDAEADVLNGIGADDVM
jgi:tRNA pseudouridine13 synthase